MVKDIRAVQKEVENIIIAQQRSVEIEALSLDDSERIEFLTNYSVEMGKMVHNRWVELGDRLVTKYNDGYIKDYNNQIREVGYSSDWLDIISKEEGERYRIPEE